MAARGPPDEAALKQRIVSHMNKDHNDSVARYLENYCKSSRLTSRNARIVDISNSVLTLKAGLGSTYTIPLDPPMNGLSDARPRLVQMDMESIESLQRSPYTLKKYVAPRGFHAVVFVVCFLVFIMLSRPQHVLPGAIAYEYFLNLIPGLASFVQQMRLVILLPMIALHVSEAYIMTKKMKTHSVPLLSGLWWAWVLSNLIEGVGAYQRIAAIIAQQKVEREKSKQ